MGKPNTSTGSRMAGPNTSRLFLRNLTTLASILESTATLVMTLCDQSDYNRVIVLDDTVEVDKVAAGYIDGEVGPSVGASWDSSVPRLLEDELNMWVQIGIGYLAGRDLIMDGWGEKVSRVGKRLR